MAEYIKVLDETQTRENFPPTTGGRSVQSISQFLAEVRSTGLSKANRFEVVIDPPACVISGGYDIYKEVVSLYADTAFMPQGRVITGRQQLFGPPEYFPIGVDYGGDNMGMNFYLDREYRIKEFFDSWLGGIIVKNDNRPQGENVRPNFVSNYRSNYLSNITIKQLDEQDNVMYAVVLRDVFPVAINVITLDHNLQNQPSRLNVTFNYRYWEQLSISAPQQPLDSKGIFDWSIFSDFGSNGSGGNAIQSPSLQPGFDPFHPDTSPASEAYWLKK